MKQNRVGFSTNRYLAITIVVHELLNFGMSRLLAIRMRSFGRWPRTIGQ